MEGQRHEPNNGVKKRSPNACSRCRQQKTKCSGTIPCTTCSKRSTVCSYDDSSKKVLVTKKYLQDLLRRAEPASSNRNSDVPSARTCQQKYNDCSRVPSESPLATFPWLRTAAAQCHLSALNYDLQSATSDDCEGTGLPLHETGLVNLLAVDSENYTTDYLGRQIHLGTSSNWAFARRVLSTVCERFGLQVPVDPIFFEGSVYDLDWNLLASRSISSHVDLMPSVDYAMYLVNAVKFHCGQMFHLFDEEMFMQHFYTFHGNEDGRLKVPQLWYTHYLVIIALAKLLVVRKTQSATPPFVKLFLEAMRSWPELIFGAKNVVECVEVLICAALYLQCLDFRSAAFSIMGHAVRKALGQGLHTQISHRPPDGPIVQRCRRIWWTVYILDRQISTLVGLPQSIRDDDISAPFPRFNTFRERIGLEIHVNLSRAIAETVNTVYSTDGRLPQKFLSSTKQALQNIARTTELLSRHIDMPKNLSSGGISRFSAYLHLLNHQCICLITRPLALSFLDRRLQSTSEDCESLVPGGSAQALLRMCINSAQQMLQILSALKCEGILESFLPFDLEATFIASVILIMAKTIDDRNSEEHVLWMTMAYSILDDMEARGNMIALARKHELQHLAKVLSGDTTTSGIMLDRYFQNKHAEQGHMIPFSRESNDTAIETNVQQSFDNPPWRDEMTADQLREIADSLELDSFDWMLVSLDDSVLQTEPF